MCNFLIFGPMINLTIQRYQPGQPNYSDALDAQGLQANFGQLISASGEVLVSTLERRDTLIPEGTYSVTLYNSPANKMIVPLLVAVPGFTGIEWHIANWPHDLKGCTGVGSAIVPAIPQLSGSTLAFNKMMSFLIGDVFMCKDANGAVINQDMLSPMLGKIIATATYEKFAG
ncbi:MAG TPA: DUF5675 family protein [Bacteroidia bacterium]|jgi:hypothetical protein|nr:DUF5675 family protein [Bacteroidia bacterium]